MKIYTITPLDSGFTLEHDGKLAAVQGTDTNVIDAVSDKIRAYINTSMIAGDKRPITIEIKIKI